MPRWGKPQISRVVRFIRTIQTQVSVTSTSWGDVQNCLIASSGRTGTQFFGELFHHPEMGIVSYHEPSPDLFSIAVNYFREKQPSSAVLRAIEKARKGQLKEVSQANAKYYIESNPNFVMLLPWLTKVFHDARVVCISRDIESYLLSALNKSPDNSGDPYFYGPSDRRKRLIPHDLGDDENAAAWHTWDRAVKVAWWWRWANRQLLEYVRDTPNAELFQFEKLFAPESGEFQRLLRFMGLGGTEQLYYDSYLNSVAHKKNGAPRVAYSSLDALGPSIRGKIAELTRGVRKELGYECA